MSDDRRILATNRKARHVYHILEKETAGIELLGTEVKAIREGRINLKEAFVSFVGGEAFLVKWMPHFRHHLDKALLG